MMDRISKLFYLNDFNVQFVHVSWTCAAKYGTEFALGDPLIRVSIRVEYNIGYYYVNYQSLLIFMRQYILLYSTYK